MPIPNQTITILDPGLGLVEPSSTTPLLLGCCELGAIDTLQSFSTKSAAVTALGQGPLTEAVCRSLDVAGSPVMAMAMTVNAAGAAGAVTPVRVGVSTGTITVAGTPNDSYEVQVRIVETSDGITMGTGVFDYSLDDGRTFSESINVPAGMSYTMPSTGLTLTFVVGGGPTAFELGDVHSFDCTAPYYNAAGLATAATALLADSTEWAFLILTGTPASAADGVTMFGALQTHMAAFESQFRFTRAIMDAGTDTTANVITAFGAVSDNRISVCYGSCDVSSSKSFSGWGAPSRSIVDVVGSRAAASLISTDLARVASGALVGVLSISHDEFLNEVLDVHRITTTRSWLGRPGFYITNARLKSDPGSDFIYWQYGRVMDVACKTTYLVQQNFISMGLRTTPTGTINELDAARLETRGRDALSAQLTAPSNAEGTRGHVSDFSYQIDRTNNIQVSQTVNSDVAVRPLGYSKYITTQIGFSVTV
jgi:hypothetical protein